jgi:FlaG/FlaF family flagellin (archaellin)
MDMKPIIALCVALAATPACFAGERFGRDSVYATQNAPASKVVTGVSLQRHGRDSVYATQIAGPKQEIKVGALLDRPGRA